MAEKDPNETTKKAIETAGGAVTGAACGTGVVVAVAKGATDAAALTAALATVGGGTMLVGFAAVAAVGISGFFVSRWVIRKVTRRKAQR